MITATPLVSVLVRTRDRAALLLDAIRSVLAQDYRPIELVIVNDGGVDGSAAINACIGTALPWRWLDNEGSGRSAAANTALTSARGDYCLFLDDDDWLDATHISGLVNTLQQNTASLAAYSNVRTVHDDGVVSDTVFNHGYDALRLRIENYIPIHAVLFARKLFTDGCRLDIALDRFEDWDFWLQVAQHTDFVHLPVCTANYRIAALNGFGAKESTELDPLRAAFYRKWVVRWSNAELIELLDRSRQFPRISMLQEEKQSLQQYLQHLQQHEQVLNDELKQRTLQWQQARDDLHQAGLMLKQTDDELHKRTSQWKQANDDLQQRIVLLERTSDELRQRTLQLKQSNDTLLQRDHELVSMVKSLSERDSTIQRLLHDYGVERSVTAGLRHDLHLIYQSRSWKLTKPLRYLSRVQYIWRHEGAAGVLRRAMRKLLRPTPQLPSNTSNNGLQPIGPFAFATHALPLVSIVIPVFNKVEFTFHCLWSVHANSGALPYEVIVVDDCSTDNTASVLAGISGIRVIRNDENSGFIQSCNNGAAAARGEYLLLLNNDTEPQQGWLDALVNTFRDKPDAGMVGAKLLFSNGVLQEAGGIVWRDGSAWNLGRGEDPNKPEYCYLRAVDYCSGACLLLPRADYFALGQFDRLYLPAYYEDTDLAFKVRQAGKQVYYQPLARVIHFEGVSNGTDTGGGIKAYQVANQRKFFERWETTLLQHRENGMLPLLEKERAVQKRALVVDARVLMPDNDSGSLRMFNLLKILQTLGYKVTFIPDNLQYHERYTPMMEALGIECWHRPYLDSVAHHLQTYGTLYSVVMLSRADVAEQSIDTALQFAPHAQILFDTVDLHFLRERRQAVLSGSNSEMEAAELRRLQELGVARKAHHTLVVSPVEVELFKQEAPDVQVTLVSNIHKVHGRAKPWSEREHILFIGNFEHPPNVDAMHCFIDEVFPLLQQQRPGTKLLIVGPLAPASLTAKANELIEFLGFVNDIEPVFNSVRLSIAPLRYGAGVKGKINSSMSYGVPVVASPVAAEGMGLEQNVDVLIADSPADFANAIVQAYDDEQLWDRLSDAALANLENHFSFAVATEQLRAILNLSRPERSALSG